MSKYTFEAEVGRLLHLVTNCLYKNKEVFLRELISNASDACDKARYLQLTKPDVITEEPNIRISVNQDAKTITIEDIGIGMGKQELIKNLGTIAKSGTAQFLKKLTGDAKKDSNLIGQFGVGFYTAFMVASKVEVISLGVGKKEAQKWSSDGVNAFSIEKAQRGSHGTTVILHLKKECEEYLTPIRLKTLIGKYSEHIAFPINFVNKEGEQELLNEDRTLWTRKKSEITDEQYKLFYQHIAHASDDPWHVLHYKAEGVIDYTSLLFIPCQKPYHMVGQERKSQLKLYIKRVYITDDCPELLPPYLRFVKGIVDAEDLPLNISRETLQHNPVLAKIKTTLTKKLLDALTQKSSLEDYLSFWENFGSVLKEGLQEEPTKRDILLPIVRAKSTMQEGLISLEEYVANMQENQKEIYYLVGDDTAKMLNSPHLEGFQSRNLNVLLLTDHIDKFWPGTVGKYKDFPFKSVTSGDINLSGDAEEQPEANDLIEFLKQRYEGKVKDIKISTRLKESPICFVTTHTMSPELAGILGNNHSPSTRILEINPSHPLIISMSKKLSENKESLDEIVDLLYDQALILDGQPVSDSKVFTQRMVNMMNKELTENHTDKAS